MVYPFVRVYPEDYKSSNVYVTEDLNIPFSTFEGKYLENISVYFP